MCYMDVSSLEILGNVLYVHNKACNRFDICLSRDSQWLSGGMNTVSIFFL